MNLPYTDGDKSFPHVSEKINMFIVFIKYIILTLFFVGVFYVNMKHEQKIQLEQTIQIKKRESNESDIVIDVVSSIIKREGNVSVSVAKKYALWIYAAGTRYNIDPLLILSIISVESGFNHKAISSAGPIGLFQVTYSWHKEKTTHLGLFDPKNNINVGTQILREYSDKSSTETEMLLRFNGSLGSPPHYAVKVLNKKTRYNQEILDAIVKGI